MSREKTSEQIKKFKKDILSFYKRQKRDFAWRQTTNPYNILVSEIMLQQTQTTRVVKKYDEFLARFPSLASLAKAQLKDVLVLWQGLGYNRRARFLHEGVKMINEKYAGEFPRTFEELTELPGIGQSTAGAIMNFSFNIPTSFIETNIRTVFIHHFFSHKPHKKSPKQKVSDKELLELIEKTIDRKNPRDWFYALYDYGTYLKSILDSDPAKKSTGYKKQSTFKGSFRQKRAQVLRYILKSPPVTIDEISKYFVFDSPMTNEVISSLIKDKLVEKSGNSIMAA